LRVCQILQGSRDPGHAPILILYLSILEKLHAFAKFEVCSFIRFGDMFEGVPNFIRVTCPRSRPFSDILFVHFGVIVHVHQYAKFEVCSLTGFGDMFEGVPNFIRLT